MGGVDDIRGLSGQEKAAVFLLALGEEHSSPLFERMDNEEIRELSSIMASLGSVSSKVMEKLFVEFADQLSSTGSLVGTYSSTERLLVNSLPKD
ncbi:MAG: flagellar motor switch protein FliG, partial [Rhodospirillales bacterium]|nr:flagellar motor switch protein FliG [Rhodospirillales bacterium]